MLLRDDKEANAKILVEHIIREDYTLESFEVLKQVSSGRIGRAEASAARARARALTPSARLPSPRPPLPFHARRMLDAAGDGNRWWRSLAVDGEAAGQSLTAEARSAAAHGAADGSAERDGHRSRAQA